MLLNIVIIYLYIFLCTTFILYFIYSIAILPAKNKFSKNTVEIFESIVLDYAILILMLFIFIIVNNTTFHIHHNLILLIQFIITLSCGTFLASIVSYNLVSYFKMSQKSQIISYILLFLLIFTLYAAIVIKPESI